MTDQNTWPCNHRPMEPPFTGCGPGGPVDLHPGPVGTFFYPGLPPQVTLSGMVPHGHQPSVKPEPLDPLALRFQCPCQLSYPDYLDLPMSQCHVLPGPGPDTLDCRPHREPAWFPQEPFLCSMMPGNFPEPLGLDQQPEVTPHVPPPVLFDGFGGQMVLVNPCEPGGQYTTLEQAAGQRQDGLTARQDRDVMTSAQMPQFTRAAAFLYQTTQTEPESSPAKIDGDLQESLPMKPCNCTKSQCLKLYCECFASGMMCSNCNCSNCHNNVQHQERRGKAVKACIDRNPEAFWTKKAAGTSAGVKGRNKRGCNCKRSGCLKNYCECYEVNSMCSSSCKCVGCQNYDISSQVKEKTVSVKWTHSVLTPSVLETVNTRLQLQARQAELEGVRPQQAELLVLLEFSCCLSQILEEMFK